MCFYALLINIHVFHNISLKHTLNNNTTLDKIIYPRKRYFTPSTFYSFKYPFYDINLICLFCEPPKDIKIYCAKSIALFFALKRAKVVSRQRKYCKAEKLVINEELIYSFFSSKKK